MRRSKRRAEEATDQVDIESRLAPYVTVPEVEQPHPAPPPVAWAHAAPASPSVAEDDLIADPPVLEEPPADLADDAAAIALDAIESVDAAHDASTSGHLPSVARDDPLPSPPLPAPTPVQRSLFTSVDEPQARPPSKGREAPRAVPDWERWHTPDTAHAPWAHDAAFGSALGGLAPVHSDEPHDDPDDDRG